MSLSILEVLENAEYNIKQGVVELGLNQLQNAIKLLEKGKLPDDDFNKEDLKD